jgi:hypothetical protein
MVDRVLAGLAMGEAGKSKDASRAKLTAPLAKYLRLVYVT